MVYTVDVIFLQITSLLTRSRCCRWAGWSQGYCVSGLVCSVHPDAVEDVDESDVKDGEEDPGDEPTPTGQDGDEIQDCDEDEDNVAEDNESSDHYFFLSSYSMDFQTSKDQIDKPYDEEYNQGDSKISNISKPSPEESRDKTESGLPR